MAILTATGISCVFRSGGGFHPLDLELTSGITALVGANGAGKTTLMSTLSGALLPRTGQVLVDGADLYGGGRKIQLPRVALMPQSLSPVPGVSVEEFVALFAWLRAVPPKLAESRIPGILDALGLSAKARQPVRSLSGGMFRRLLLAQALVADPEILLLDEPTSGLDPVHRAGMRELVAGLGPRCILMSSHVIEDVSSLAGRVIVMHEGRLVVDSPRKLLPASSAGLEKEVVRLSTQAWTGAPE